MTREEAELAGYMVDMDCYPWVAYKGGRWRPETQVDCLTDLEAELLEALRAISEAYLGDCPAAQDELAHAMGHIQYLRNLAHAAITKATARGDME